MTLFSDAEALDRYLVELPRVQLSRQTRQRWWEDFGRQQELFWRMWQARFDSVFEQDLEAIWADPIRHRLERSIPLADASRRSRYVGNLEHREEQRPSALSEEVRRWLAPEKV